MQSNLKEIIEEIKQTLEKKYSSFTGLYLFGSRKTNVNNENSDVDIALIFDREITPKFKTEIIDLIYDFDLKYELFFDCKIFSKEELSAPSTPFRSVIKEKGVFYGLR
jgi:predicted nucleotidyltransferase